MRTTMSIDFSKTELSTFAAKCNAAIVNLGTGTKKATEAASNEIMAESLKQVPRFTDTLANSAYVKVSRRSDTSVNTWAYGAEIGYGGNGDPINPLSGLPASAYMVEVHEDTGVYHMTGKSKFLEDPIRDYAANNFKRTVFKYAKESLAGMSK